MSAFDRSIPDLLQRQIDERKEMVERMKAEKAGKLAALDKELSVNIALWEGEISALENLKDLKWDYYAKQHLENK